MSFSKIYSGKMFRRGHWDYTNSGAKRVARTKLLSHIRVLDRIMNNWRYSRCLLASRKLSGSSLSKKKKEKKKKKDIPYIMRPSDVFSRARKGILIEVFRDLNRSYIPEHRNEDSSEIIHL